MKFHLQSAAKVNLTLDILSRRADGYHELASVVHTVGIWDEIDLELLPGGPVSFRCNRADLAGDDNLCVRAVRVWNQATGDDFGARIHLEKRIPTGAGLGGGSGNAAAILLALNQAAETPVSEEKLCEIGAKLGADVPLFLRGGAVLMEGIGEKLTPLAPLEGWVLVVKPEESYSTPAIYRAWDDGEFQSQRDTPRLIEVWDGGNVGAIAACAGNDLERAAAQISKLPAQLIALLRDAGALGARMSGSGSACFGVFEAETAAREAKSRLQTVLAKDVLLRDAQVFVAPFTVCGVEIARV